MNATNEANVWEAKNGRRIRFSELSTDHLLNIINFLRRNYLTNHPTFDHLVAIALVRCKEER